jgi:hypothetical protein
MRILVREGGSHRWAYADTVSADTEAELQQLVAESPSLIPVNEIRDGIGELAVGIREIGLPGSGKTDVIAFTPQGEIALVECKLAANQEGKRKVIGQILEYAAFLWEMPYDALDAKVQVKSKKPLAEMMADAVAADWDEETFRTNVGHSLATGDFLLIIVVDQINDELRQIIKFINERGTSGFTLHALELERFQRQGMEIIVPLLHGTSTKTTQPSSKGVQWNETRFFQTFEQGKSAEIAARAKQLYDWATSICDRIWFGTGIAQGSFTLHFLKGKKTISVFTLYTDGRLTINYGWLSRQVPEHIIKDFHKRLIAIPGFSKIAADFTKWPSVPIAEAFNTDEAFSAFKNVVNLLKGEAIKETT